MYCVRPIQNGVSPYATQLGAFLYCYMLWQTDLNAVCTETDQHTTIQSVLWQTDTPPYSLSVAVTHHINTTTTTTTTQSVLVAEQHRIQFLIFQTGTHPYSLYCGIHMYLHTRKLCTRSLAPVRWCFILLQEYGRLLFLWLQIDKFF